MGDRDEIRRNITAIMDSLGSLKLRFDEVNEQNGRNSIKIMDIGDTVDDAEKRMSRTEPDIEAYKVQTAQFVEDFSQRVEKMREDIETIVTKDVEFQGYIINITRSINDNITAKEGIVDEVQESPIGAIEAWIGGSSGPNIPLPDGWMKCDGSSIPEGPLAGRPTPKLNGDGGHFLRGGQAGAAYPGAFQEDAIRNYEASIDDQGHSHRINTGTTSGFKKCSGSCSAAIDINTVMEEPEYTSTARTDIKVEYQGAEETRPKSFSVEWIMRIK